MNLNKWVLLVLSTLAVGACLLLGTQVKRAVQQTAQDPARPHERTSRVQKALAPQEITLPAGSFDVPVRPVVPLSGVSKRTVYKLRQEAVAASPFAYDGYEPSDAVFGAIVSGKPWIEADLCADRFTQHHKTKGPSEETRFINNPTALIALEYPFMFRQDGAEWCSRADANNIIQKITYDGDQREITVTYLALPFQVSKNNTFYAFNGLNARDLGYPYMFVDMRRSTYYPVFLHADNASTQVVQIQNYIHLGSSCGVSGGCNNGSPRQAFFEFAEDPLGDTYPTPREIYIKLWKNEPASPDDPADMTERIVILNALPKVQ